MSNPFLFDDDDVEPSNESAPNPFLLSNTAETDAMAAEAEESDNPFLAEAVNPFALTDDSENVAVIPKKTETPSVDKAMSFFGTTITEDDEHEPVEPPSATFVINEPVEGDKKAPAPPPPPRPTPPNPTTQDLISSVADQLDQNSSHLLDRIPKTRTPSPVSMRDLHSPSPTPDSTNLLMDDAFEMDSVATNNVLRSDNPFADVEDEPIFQHEAAQSKPQPPRPVPPRPTPFPQENKVEAAPAQEPEADLFDFGTNTPAPKPPAPKSNQDIMSLFSAPKAAEPPKPDLLTSEISLMDSAIAPIQSNSNLPSQIIPTSSANLPAQVIPSSANLPSQVISSSVSLPPQVIPSSANLPPQVVPSSVSLPPQAIPSNSNLPPQVIPSKWLNS